MSDDLPDELLALSNTTRIPYERLRDVYEMWTAGKPDLEIRAAVSEEHNVTSATVRRYIKLVADAVGDRPAPNLPAVRHRSEQILLEALQFAKSRKSRNRAGAEYADPDIGMMVTIATRLAELFGVTKQRLEVTGADGKPFFPAAIYVPQVVDTDNAPIDVSSKPEAPDQGTAERPALGAASGPPTQ